MGETMELEVLGVSRGQDVSGGDVVQVNFGTTVTVDEAWKANLAESVRSSKTVGKNTAVLFLKLEGAVPYKLGAKWRLTVADNGDITITEVS
jgi:hypothetical protein